MTAGVIHNLDAFDEVKQLHAEIARLRTALETIAGNKLESRAKLEFIARHALEPKP